MDGTALVLCEANFDDNHGKTAHGLVRHTDRYDVAAVIDSTLSGRDSGEVLDGKANGIPIVASVNDGLSVSPKKPTHLVIGVSTSGGVLPPELRPMIIDALTAGLTVDSGLHEFLNDDAELVSLASAHGGAIRDIRRPPPRNELHFFTEQIDTVRAKRIAVLGTDCALGKRTTAVIVVQALNELGRKSELIGTGQTSWFQGVRYGVFLDSIVNDFVGGEIEHAVLQAADQIDPDFMLIEGQACLGHPGGSGGFEILGSARPQGVILQHAPIRDNYLGYDIPLASPEANRDTIESLFGSKVVAIGLNPEGYDATESPRLVAEYEERMGVPVCDPLTEGPEKLVDAVLAL